MMTQQFRQTMAKATAYRPFAIVLALALATLGLMWLFR
jgi:hypothetical protein